MRKIYSTLVLCFVALFAWAQQTSLRGVVKSETTGQPLPGVTVTLGDQNLSTTTNENGEFLLQFLQSGGDELLITLEGYMPTLNILTLKDGVNDLGDISLKEDLQSQLQQDVVLQLSEVDLNDDEGKGQNTSSSTNAQSDVYTSTIGYAWSSVRFRQRGLENIFEETYINGINFNSQERGNFNYSMLGGLNDASRNKDVYQGIEANSFGYGGIGQQTNIDMRATSYAQGWKVGLAGANRNYKMRVNATYASGLLDNGWAFAASLAYRYSPMFNIKGIIGEGVDYNSLGYFFSAEKRFGRNHSLSLVTFGSPTQRGQNAAVTQEVYDLTGSIYYNPYWGYQNGKPRNSRVVKSFDPTAIISYEWKVNDQNKLNFAAGYHYSMYSNSAITFFDATDPRPDYYRNLPSFMWDGQFDENGRWIYNMYDGSGWNGTAIGDGNKWTSLDGYTLGPSIDPKNYNELVSLWQNRDNTTTQVNWDALYQANYSNNANNPNGVAKYMVERRHNDLREAMAHVLYTGQVLPELKVTAGLDLKASEGVHYKTVDDLLGANQWIDYDPFAERDIKDLAENIGMTQADIEHVKQNDVRNPDRVVKKGDVFGYNYHINMMNAAVFAQNEWNWNRVQLFYALKLNYNSFWREGLMENGRADYLAKVIAPSLVSANYSLEQATEWTNYVYKSFGVGQKHNFLDPSFKIGVKYNINGRNRLKLNALAETKAPFARDAYISQRIHDRAISVIERHDAATSLKDFYAASQRNLAYDLTYEFNYPIVRGRITAYQAWLLNGSELNGYYDDEARTFVNQAVTGINRVHTGIEAAAAIKLGLYFTLTPAITVSDNRYIKNAYSVTSAENGMALASDFATGKPLYELRDSVLINGLRVANGPQLAGSLKLSFFHPKMWFADITVSYFDWNYLDYAPSRRMKGLFTGERADGSTVNGQYNVTGEVDKYGTPIVAGAHYYLAAQESLVDPMWYNRLMVDASVGKLIYLPKRQSLSINLSVSNLTNNTHMKTGGYQQARLPRLAVQGSNESIITANYYKFPAKYYYAWGANFFLNITYKF